MNEAPPQLINTFSVGAEPPSEPLLAEIACLRALNAELVAALGKVVAANEEFRKTLPDGWDGDPVDDACKEARAALAKAKGEA